MNILTTQNFNEKLKVLDTASLNILKSLLEKMQCKDSTLDELIISNDVYAVRDSDVTLFYTKKPNENEDATLILLDLVPLQNKVQGMNLFTTSPTRNDSLNPVKNRALNPNYNRALNPIYNRAINPIYNRALNPIYNRAINPIYNRALNPIYNRAINPKFNKAFKGPYLYTIDQKQVGFLIAADHEISVVFNNDMKRIGMLAPIDENLKAFFDENNKYSGYFVKASNEVWLHFDQNAKWIGFLTNNL